MGYVVAAAMVLLELWKKESKVVTGLFLLFFWAMVALNEGSADFRNYELMYIYCFDPAFSLHEPGYILLSRLFLTLGFSYRQFRMVIAAFISLLSVQSVRYFTKNVNFALALHVLFPFAAGVSGLRNTLAGAIVLFSIHFLFQEKKGALIRYFLGILIATLFHYNSLFFLIMPVAKIKKLNIYLLFALTVLSIPILVILAQTGVLYTVASWVTTSTKVLNWLTSSINISPLYIVAFIPSVFVIFLLYRSQMLIPEGTKSGNLSKDDIIAMAKMGVLSLISFSGAIFRSVVFLRLLIGLMLLFYAFLVQALSPAEQDPENVAREKTLWRRTLPLFSIMLTLFVFCYWIGGNALANYANNLLYTWF